MFSLASKNLNNCAEYTPLLEVCPPRPVSLSLTTKTEAVQRIPKSIFTDRVNEKVSQNILSYILQILDDSDKFGM